MEKLSLPGKIKKKESASTSSYISLSSDNKYLYLKNTNAKISTESAKNKCCTKNNNNNKQTKPTKQKQQKKNKTKQNISTVRKM